jgi:enoyl-CoA hydratase/carnithine racemase
VDYQEILHEQSDGVALVTLNRPEKLNAMTALMGAEMADAMAEADADDAVRAVVLTGAGRAFCAGADLGSGKDFAAGWGGVEREYRRMMPMEVRKPVIAAINGPAVGAGLTWPLQADIRYVASDAKLAFAFVRRGVLPELASHVILPRLAGLSRASELLLSGRTFLGDEAVEYGVATRAFPKDEVLAAAMDMARDIAVNATPLPVAIAKHLISRCGRGKRPRGDRRRGSRGHARLRRRPHPPRRPDRLGSGLHARQLARRHHRDDGQLRRDVCALQADGPRAAGRHDGDPKDAILGGLPWDWEDYGGYLDAIERLQPGLNVA